MIISFRFLRCNNKLDIIVNNIDMLAILCYTKLNNLNLLIIGRKKWSINQLENSQ